MREIDDRLLHLFALTTNPVRLALLPPDIIRGRLSRSRWVHTLVDEQFRIRTGRPMRIRADGKMIAETPAESVCVGAHLRFCGGALDPGDRLSRK